jgi:hypothetical protein
MRFLVVRRNPYLFSIDYGVTKASEIRHTAAIAKNSGFQQPLRKLALLNNDSQELRLA